MLECLPTLEQIGIKSSYNKGDILFYEGEVPSHLYLLLSGVLHLYKSDKSGTKITMHYLKPINFIAEMALFKNIPYPATAAFQANSVVLSVPFYKFKESLSNNPNLSLILIASLAEKIRILNNKINQNMLLPLKGRLINYILENISFLKDLSQLQIAQELHVAPQSLSRMLRELKEEGLIEVKKGKISVLDTDKLVAISNLNASL